VATARVASWVRVISVQGPRALVLTTAIAVLALGLAGQGQESRPPDTATIGPQVGAVVPAFSGVDQFGKTRTLESVLGAKGAMLVFFRSAEW
jgi:hypothetical protein